MEIILQQRVLGQNLLCLCLDFCGLCPIWGLATLDVKGIPLLWHYTGMASCYTPKDAVT